MAKSGKQFLGLADGAKCNPTAERRATLAAELRIPTAERRATLAVELRIPTAERRATLDDSA